MNNCCEQYWALNNVLFGRFLRKPAHNSDDQCHLQGRRRSPSAEHVYSGQVVCAWSGLFCIEPAACPTGSVHPYGRRLTDEAGTIINKNCYQCSDISINHFLGVGKNFRLLMQSCRFFFSRPFHENFKFVKKCPYDFHKILHSHSTPKGAPACSKASKSYDWNVKNIAKISPKMARISSKSAIFRLFSIFSKTDHTIGTKFSTVILHHIRVLYMQMHQNRMAGM